MYSCLGPLNLSIENRSVLKKNLSTKDEIIKKLVEAQSRVFNTISRKSHNQHSNTLTQANFSLPYNSLNENSHNTNQLDSQEQKHPPTTLFFTTARRIASYLNTPPKIRAKYHYKKYVCIQFTRRYHQTRYL